LALSTQSSRQRIAHHSLTTPSTYGSGGLRPAVRLRRAWALDDHAHALDQLRRLARELDRIDRPSQLAEREALAIR
jgi:hypothetical protein